MLFYASRGTVGRDGNMRSPTVVEKHVHAGRFRTVMRKFFITKLVVFRRFVRASRRRPRRGIGRGCTHHLGATHGAAAPLHARGNGTQDGSQLRANPFLMK